MTISVKKIEEKMRQKELSKKNQELYKLNEEVNERMREDAKKKEELKRLLELDKKERATNSKAVDSKANDLKFGATVIIFSSMYVLLSNCTILLMFKPFPYLPCEFTWIGR